MNHRLALACAVLCLSGSPAWSDVVRDSVGTLRAEQAKLELKPFPADAWSKLAAWNGEALSAASAAGKPVLIVTWASWHPSSLRALPAAQVMADTYGARGLVVVGIHHQQGWDKAAEAATSRGIKFASGHDADGSFRSSMKIGKDPSFYVIDRAGALRYAAVASQSLDEACSTVVGETPEQAAGYSGQLAAAAAAAAAESGRTRELGAVDLSRLPALPPSYVKPDDSVYADATWPKVSEELGKSIGLLDQQGARATPRFAFKPQGFFPSPPEMAGRATVVYFWHPDFFQSFDKVMREMDQLQLANSRDLAVIGALVPASAIDQSRANQPGGSAERPAEFVKRVTDFMASRSFKHTLAADASASGLATLAGSGGTNIKDKLPFCVLVSSDGVIRWAGSPLSSDFKYAITTTLLNDPGIKARRAADQEFIRSSK